MQTRHTSLTIALHWVSAALVLALLAVGLTMANLDAASETRLTLTRLHILGGLLLGAVLFARIFSLLGREPIEPLALPRWQRLGSALTRALIYLSLIAMVLTGFLTLALADLAPWLLGDAPEAPGFAGVWPRPLHHWLARGILLLVAVHLTGVFVQHARTRNVLQRMGWPF